MKRSGTLTRRLPGRKPQGTIPARKGRCLPAAWLFTDACRLADPLPALAALPRGSGVIFRHYETGKAREALARQARITARRRGLVFLLAGDARMALRLDADGLHLPEAAVRRAGRLRETATAAAHGFAAIVAAWRAGASAVFISPVFATASHPNAASLGVLRFALLQQRARQLGLRVYALGGVDAANWRRLVPLRPDGSGGIGRYLGEDSAQKKTAAVLRQRR